jgi:hypothetical protein
VYEINVGSEELTAVKMLKASPEEHRQHTDSLVRHFFLTPGLWIRFLFYFILLLLCWDSPKTRQHLSHLTMMVEIGR